MDLHLDPFSRGASIGAAFVCGLVLPAGIGLANASTSGDEMRAPASSRITYPVIDKTVERRQRTVTVRCPDRGKILSGSVLPGTVASVAVGASYVKDNRYTIRLGTVENGESVRAGLVCLL